MLVVVFFSLQDQDDHRHLGRNRPSEDDRIVVGLGWPKRDPAEGDAFGRARVDRRAGEGDSCRKRRIQVSAETCRKEGDRDGDGGWMEEKGDGVT